MPTDVSSILQSKFRQTEIDGLSHGNDFLIFSNFSNHCKIQKDLEAKEYKNFIGYIVPYENLNYPSPDFPKNQYLNLTESENFITDGSHLVITADVFIELIQIFGIEKIENWTDRIHIAKIIDWLQDRSGRDIYRHFVPRWSYKELHEGNIKESHDRLKLFLKIYGPRELEERDQFLLLADNDTSGLLNGDIAAVLHTGTDLSSGWIFYKDAVSKRVAKECAPLQYPFWNGEPFSGNKIVFRREMGPADEIAYANVFNDLLKDGIEIIIETDPRLVSLFERSFPGAEIIPRLAPAHPRLLESDINYQANFSDPYLEYRSEISAFPNHNGYIKPDQTLKQHWQDYFESHFHRQFKIGISWGSKSTGSVEDKMKTQIQQWEPILRTPEACFINLQYGDAKEDLLWAKTNLGIEIHEIIDLDLYNDLDALAAVIANLDLVISVNNINSHMAGAVGTRLWEIVPKFWWLLLGQNFNPFYPGSRIFDPTQTGLKNIAARLLDEIRKFSFDLNIKTSTDSFYHKKFGVIKFHTTALDTLDPFLILGDGELEQAIFKDLEYEGYEHFLGYIAHSNENEPATTAVTGRRYSYEEAQFALKKGCHLVLSSNQMQHLLEIAGLDTLFRSKELLHIVKIWHSDNFNPAQDNPYKLKCMNQRLFTSWLMDHVKLGHAKYCALALDLFFECCYLPDTTPEQRRSILVKELNTGLPNGEIAAIYFAAGELENGLRFYQDAIGVMTERDCTKLPHPYWEGEDFSNKKVIFRRVPGPGDEVLYASVFNDVIADGCKPIIEVDPRLFQLFKRSFSEAIIIPRDETKILPQLLEPDTDFQASYSDPFSQYRNSIEKFTDHNGYLIADQELVSDWKTKLNHLFPRGLNVGLSWKSSSVGKFEDTMSTQLTDWLPLLAIPDVNFINLQYGNVENELKQLNSQPNVEIHQLPGIDLFNDFSGLAAIMKNLDLIISVNNITAHLAGAIGATLWHICPFYWFQLFGQDYDPINPRAKIFDITDETFLLVSRELSNIISRAKHVGNLQSLPQNIFQRKIN